MHMALVGQRLSTFTDQAKVIKKNSELNHLNL